MTPPWVAQRVCPNPMPESGRSSWASPILPNSLLDRDVAVDTDAHAPGVVATILQTTQRGEYHPRRHPSIVRRIRKFRTWTQVSLARAMRGRTRQLSPIEVETPVRSGGARVRYAHRLRFVPAGSPRRFVGTVTTVPTGRPPAEWFDRPSPRQLAVQASPGASSCTRSTRSALRPKSYAHDVSVGKRALAVSLRSPDRAIILFTGSPTYPEGTNDGAQNRDRRDRPGNKYVPVGANDVGRLSEGLKPNRPR